MGLRACDSDLAAGLRSLPGTHGSLVGIGPLVLSFVELVADDLACASRVAPLRLRHEGIEVALLDIRLPVVADDFDVADGHADPRRLSQCDQTAAAVGGVLCEANHQARASLAGGDLPGASDLGAVAGAGGA